MELSEAQRYKSIKDARKAKRDKVYKLALQTNDMETLPSGIGKLTYLASLDVANNGLTDLPEEIARLKSMRKLDLARNQISTLPKDITKLSETLTELDIQGNQIPMEEIYWLIEAMPNTKILY